MRSFDLQWDRDYGIDHRKGWTVVIDGSVCSELEPWLVVAMWKGFRTWRRWKDGGPDMPKPMPKPTMPGM
jgi:hypothetical protein